MDKLIIITNTNLLSIACICTKNILAYYVSECPAQSIADTIKEIDTTLYTYERIADPFNNKIYRWLNILVSITGLAFTPTIVYSSHLLTKTGIQTVSVQFLRDLLHFLQK